MTPRITAGFRADHLGFSGSLRRVEHGLGGADEPREAVVGYSLQRNLTRGSACSATIATAGASARALRHCAAGILILMRLRAPALPRRFSVLAMVYPAARLQERPLPAASRRATAAPSGAPWISRQRRPGASVASTRELACRPHAIPAIAAAASSISIPRARGVDARDEPRVRLDQRDEQFVRTSSRSAGTTVDFPNNDRTDHNVFSLSQTRSFDLGRYAPAVEGDQVVVRGSCACSRHPLAHERLHPGSRTPTSP